MLSTICKKILEDSNTDDIYDINKFDNYYNNIIIYENIFADNYHNNKYILSLASERVRNLIFKYITISDLYKQTNSLITEYKNTKKLKIKISNNIYIYNLYNKENTELPNIIDIDDKIFDSIRPSLLVHINYLKELFGTAKIDSTFKYKNVIETIVYFHTYASEILYIKIIADISKKNTHLIHLIDTLIGYNISKIFSLNYDFINVMKIDNNIFSNKYKIYNDNIPQLVLYDNIYNFNIDILKEYTDKANKELDVFENLLEIKLIYIFLIILLVFIIFLIIISSLYVSSTYRKVMSFYIFIVSLLLSLYLYIHSMQYIESFANGEINMHIKINNEDERPKKSANDIPNFINILKDLLASLLSPLYPQNPANPQKPINPVNPINPDLNMHMKMSRDNPFTPTKEDLDKKFKTLFAMLNIKLNMFKNNFINIIEEIDYDANIDKLNIDKDNKRILYKKKLAYLKSKYTEMDKVKTNNKDEIFIMNIILLLIIIISFLNLVLSFLT